MYHPDDNERSILAMSLAVLEGPGVTGTEQKAPGKISLVRPAQVLLEDTKTFTKQWVLIINQWEVYKKQRLGKKMSKSRANKVVQERN